MDFDGTIVDHQFPLIGEEVPGAIAALKEFMWMGARLILWTVRSNTSGSHLDDAVAWCRARGVEFWAVNERPDQRPWSRSPKVHAHVFIDDAAFGCPLRAHPSPLSRRPCVDWGRVRMAIEGWLIGGDLLIPEASR